MKIYTKTGDLGETSIIGGRVSKDSLKVSSYGTIDELNSFIGNAVSLLQVDQDKYSDIISYLTEIQHELFDAGCDLAQSGSSDYLVNSAMTEVIEDKIDKYEKECAPLSNFILPGGSQAAAALHICRSVTRRAERLVVTLCKSDKTNSEVRKYLNRLSDLFFVLARTANARLKQPDIKYRSRNK